MRRLVILILILLGLFSLFFYLSLGTQPKIIGDETTPPTGTALDSTLKNNPIYASYVYVKGVGYLLRDRRIILLIGQDTAKDRHADAIKKVEKELENYWKWQILSGKKSIEELLPNEKLKEYSTNQRPIAKNIFSRILDVFKVADAVNVVPDDNKTCDCDKNLLLLAGKGLHLIETSLNPGGGAEGGRSPQGETAEGGSHFKQNTTDEPQQGNGKSYQNTSFLVGIIDSGVNPEPAIGAMRHPLNYNFLNKTSNVIDSNSIKHGTMIARVIVEKSGKSGYAIVGLKTFDENNIGNLYDNLCAILYAAKNNIKVINASWGALSQEPIPVFDEVMRRAKAATMILISSAGNKHEDLDLHSYYPACYADHSELGNYVISVTSKKDTIINGESAFCQNFSTSGKKIDLTVRANERCNHGVPDASGSMALGAIRMLNGTSYAAPQVTAEVIKYLLKNPSGFSKSGFINAIPPQSDVKKY